MADAALRPLARIPRFRCDLLPTFPAVAIHPLCGSDRSPIPEPFPIIVGPLLKLWEWLRDCCSGSDSGSGGGGGGGGGRKKKVKIIRSSSGRTLVVDSESGVAVQKSGVFEIEVDNSQLQQNVDRLMLQIRNNFVVDRDMSGDISTSE